MLRKPICYAMLRKPIRKRNNTSAMIHSKRLKTKWRTMTSLNILEEDLTVQRLVKLVSRSR